jgi:hypothetical protein
MATASTHGKNVRSAQAATPLLWQDALLSWGIPTLLGGAIVIIALLAVIDEIAPSTGVTALGFLLLLVMFFPLRAVLAEAIEPHQKTLMLGLSLLWIVITCTQRKFPLSW